MCASVLTVQVEPHIYTGIQSVSQRERERERERERIRENQRDRERESIRVCQSQCVQREISEKDSNAA